jgi:hypothetical protein
MDNEPIRVLFSLEARIMTQLENAIPALAPGRDGWTPARRAKFLECLAAAPNVRRACAAVGLSREAAYRLRRRDPAFAVAWAEAHRRGYEARVQALVSARPGKPLRTLSTASTVSTEPLAWMPPHLRHLAEALLRPLPHRPTPAGDPA